MLPKRILHVTSVLNYGGIENLILGVLKNIDREKIVFDFLVIREEYGILEEEIRSLGGVIHKIPAIKKTGYLGFKKNLKKFFTDNPQYSIVHSHVNTLSGIVLECAKICGIPTRIAHSHTAYPKYNFFEGLCKSVFKRKLPKVATDYFACSDEAGKWLFGKESNFTVIKNGIDIDRFAFSKETREQARADLKLENKLVIINVGRFSKEKNQLFLLDILKELLIADKNVRLICVGSGKLKEVFEKKISDSSLQEFVLLTEATSNVEYFLNASDVYVSPSLFEGFGSSVAEAQVNSLPCILSDGYPKSVNFTDNCIFLSHESSAKTWAEKIFESTRKNNVSFLEYSISNTADFLLNFYFYK